VRKAPQIDGVELLLEAIEAAQDRCQIVAVAAGLLQNVAGDELLALDLALDDGDARFKLGELSHSHVRDHCD
jgi:hypothetical protein